jgi:glutamine synthetase
MQGSFSLGGKDAAGPILDLIEKNDIRFVRLIIIDLNGRPRAMLIPKYEMENALEEGMGFDGSSIPGFSTLDKSDLVARPDSESFVIPPWEHPNTADMFCYVYRPSGMPFEGDPRGLLRSVVDELQKKDLQFNTGPELEFFYVSKESERIRPLDEGGYFDMPPVDPTEKVMRETIINLENIGFRLDKVHHEVASGQHEINFRFDDALKTADRAILFKLAVKNIAKKYGLAATFMPKPFWGINGSGCHVHQSLVDNGKGRNLFFDDASPNSLSEMALHYIGGLLEHSRGLSLIVAPIVNSYKRLVPHYEAPVYLSWGLGNRSALVRIPIYYPGKELSIRLEYRHPDPSCNPYLASVAMLKAGLDGVSKKLDPGGAINENIYQMKDRDKLGVLPGSLGEAVEAFLMDRVVIEALGKHISEAFVEQKKKEFSDYLESTGGWEKTCKTITDWEINKYLDQV